MRDDFMPTTEQVRDAYTYDPEYEYRRPDNPGYVHENRRRFDRWLAQDRANAQAAVIAWFESLTSAPTPFTIDRARQHFGLGPIAESGGLASQNLRLANRPHPFFLLGERCPTGPNQTRTNNDVGNPNREEGRDEISRSTVQDGQ